jgi:arsenate reductase (thioredoxin)
MPGRFHVLFLCTGNSARSIFAEAILNFKGRPDFSAYSAGSHPSGSIHSQALRQLALAGLPAAGLRSKSWDEFGVLDAPRMDFVFTVCDSAAREICPVWPGQPMTAHWGLPDPSVVQGTEVERRLAFADAHRMLYQRIGIFTNLPLASLDKLSLQKRLDAIGRTEAPTPEPTK